MTSNEATFSSRGHLILDATLFHLVPPNSRSDIAHCNLFKTSAGDVVTVAAAAVAFAAATVSTTVVVATRTATSDPLPP